MSFVRTTVLFGAVLSLLQFGCGGTDSPSPSPTPTPGPNPTPTPGPNPTPTPGPNPTPTPGPNPTPTPGPTPGTGIDISGTWYTKVSAPGKITAAISDDVTINAWIRTHLSPNGDFSFSICKLLATGGSSLASTYSPALINTLETSAKKPGSIYAQIGDSITLPTFTTYSGRDTSGNSVDNVPPPFPAGDGDGNPGVTIPTTVGGLLEIDVYAGLVITTTMSGVKLSDATTMKGETSFQTKGVVFSSTNTVLVPPNSTIDVTTNDATILFTAVKLDSDGSTTCEEIAKKP